MSPFTLKQKSVRTYQIGRQLKTIVLYKIVLTIGVASQQAPLTEGSLKIWMGCGAASRTSSLPPAKRDEVMGNHLGAARYKMAILDAQSHPR